MKNLFYLICLASFSGLTAQVDLTSNLKVCMPFNGNANDNSGNVNNGAVFNCTLTTDRFGNANSAYQFSNAASSHIAISSFSAIAPTNELTISMWAKSDLTTSNCLFILSPDNASDRCLGCAQYVSGANTMMIWDYGDFSSGGRTTVSSLPTDVANWHYYTYIISQSGNVKQMYLDGVIKSNANYSLTCINKNFPLFIGGGFSNGGNTAIMWNGKIDDVCIYNRALNSNEVSALYNGTNACFTVGLEELSAIESFQVYPAISPEGQYTLSSGSNKGTIEIYSAEGKLVKQYQKQQEDLHVDLKNESAGCTF